MKNKMSRFKLKSFAAIALFSSYSASFAQPQTGVKNIVIVHGAFADASGWESIFKILQADGYNGSKSFDVLFMSHAKTVADIIETAAKAVTK